MDLFKSLNIDITIQSLITLYGSSNIGKTTLFILLASELIKTKQKVLIITPHRWATHKLNRLDLSHKLGVIAVVSNLTSMDELKTLVKDNNFKYIFVDSDDDFVTKNLKDIQSFVKSEKITTFVSQSIRRTCLLGEQGVHRQLNNMSDVILRLSDKTSFSIKDRFDKLFGKKPNRVITTIKNRYGKEATINLELNFETLTYSI